MESIHVCIVVGQGPPSVLEMGMIMTRYLVLMAGIMLVGVSVGCASKLETGYEPRKLGATESQRRAFYASPYSPEARPEGAPAFSLPRNPGAGM